MEHTVLLAQVFGIYLLIGGLGIWFKRSFFAPVLGSFANDPLQRLIVGTLELVSGLFLVLTHNVWTSAPAAIISLLGWMLTIEGAFYIVAPERMIAGMIKSVNVRAWYTFGAIVALVLGVYLIAFGFGWLS